jgi:hypothetical protein
MAKVLEKYYECFLEAVSKDGHSFLVNYNEGAFEIVNKIAKLTNTTFSETEILAIKERSGFHSKYPDQVFSETAIEAAIPAYQERAFALYHELEDKRTLQRY